jgi:catechol 2,3-dioxygenase-like lactoylglutathione lyase family enzyme
MNLKHISLVSIPVTDQDKAKDFYTAMLGFTVKLDVVMDAATAGGAGEGADDAYAELTGRGVQPNNQVEDAPWGRWFGVDDPDGNNWLITQERGGS